MDKVVLYTRDYASRSMQHLCYFLYGNHWKVENSVSCRIICELKAYRPIWPKLAVSVSIFLLDIPI